MSSEQKLDIVETIKDGVSIGLKNLFPILVNVVLWMLTCWIPYLNVGTSIGLTVGIVSKASRGETISSTEIFDSKYRKYMGEYFIVVGLVNVGILIGILFGIIPGIVIGVAWCLAALLLIDKEKNPTEAISLSNSLTYGHKWKLFAVYMLVIIVFAIVSAIFGLIPILGTVLNIAVAVIAGCVYIGLQASIYKQLATEV